MGIHPYNWQGGVDLGGRLPPGVTASVASIDPFQIRITISDDLAKADLDEAMAQYGFFPTPMLGVDATQHVSAIFGLSGIVTVMFPRPFAATPRVVASARALSAVAPGRWVDVVKVTPLAVTVRLWEIATVIVVGGASGSLVDGEADISATGPVA